MNKWQIICPLVAIAVAFAMVAVISGSNHHRHFISAQTHMVGEELITTTNSTRLLHVGDNLREQLLDLLRARASVSEALMGDDPPPIADGKASSRLILSNTAGMQLQIRLRQDSEPGRFEVLGCRIVTRARE